MGAALSGFNLEVHAHPKEAKEKILAVLRKHGMHRALAAKELHSSNRQLVRWIKRLGMHDEVRKMDAEAEKKGWHHGKSGGRTAHDVLSVDLLRRALQDRRLKATDQMSTKNKEHNGYLAILRDGKVVGHVRFSDGEVYFKT